MYNGNTKWGLHLHLTFHREGLHIGGVRLVSWGGAINIYHVCVAVVLTSVEVALTVDLKPWK